MGTNTVYKKKGKGAIKEGGVVVTWWVIIALTLLLGICIDTRGIYYRLNGVVMQKGSKAPYWFAVGIMIFFAGLRSTSGAGMMSIGDTRVYNGLFNTIVQSNITSFIESSNFEGDWGFYALMSFFRGVFYANNQALFFICSLTTMGCLFYRYYKLDLTDKETLFFLFITCGMYVSTMNGVRQWLASSILFLVFPLIKKKRWVPYFTIVLLVSTIHSSALIFLVLFFVVNNKAWGATMKGMIFCTLVLIVSYPVTGRYISILLAESDNFSQYSDQVVSSGYGANVIRILVYILPILLAFRFRNKMKSEPYYDIIINCAVLDMLFMMLAVTNWIYARLCIYFEPFMLIVYVWVLKYCFASNSKKLARILYYAAFLAYFWYQMYVGYGGQIYTSQVLGIGW